MILTNNRAPHHNHSFLSETSTILLGKNRDRIISCYKTRLDCATSFVNNYLHILYCSILGRKLYYKDLGVCTIFWRSAYYTRFIKHAIKETHFPLRIDGGLDCNFCCWYRLLLILLMLLLLSIVGVLALFASVIV